MQLFEETRYHSHASIMVIVKLWIRKCCGKYAKSSIWFKVSLGFKAWFNFDWFVGCLWEGQLGRYWDKQRGRRLWRPVCTCESQHIWACQKQWMEDVKNSLYLCRKIGFILIHFVNSSFESQERRMGHGKSRPLRNLSKKKGFWLFQIFCLVSRIIVTIASSKVENACLGVFAGKACVWWVNLLVSYLTAYILSRICIYNAYANMHICIYAYMHMHM